MKNSNMKLEGYPIEVHEDGSVTCGALSISVFRPKLIDTIHARMGEIDELSKLEKALKDARKAYNKAFGNARYVKNRTDHGIRFCATGIQVGCQHLPTKQLRAIIAASLAARKKSGKKK